MTTKISIHDYENGRAIHATVPEWIVDACKDASVDVADVLMHALGLNDGSTEYMFYTTSVVDVELTDLVQDFEANAREAITDLQ